MELKKCNTQAEVIAAAQVDNPNRKVATLNNWCLLPRQKLHSEDWADHRLLGTGKGDMITGKVIFLNRELKVAVTKGSIYKLNGREEPFPQEP